ncbi:MAG TPA: efflux RND transporter periplasmic adaptor subunit, partial [Candidatus Methylomirabilis sp.]
LSEGAVTPQEHSERRLALEVEAVKQGAHRSELVQVRSGLAAARASQEKAELNLERTEIRAPFAGVVADMELSAGQHITMNDLVCTLVDNVNLEAKVAVLESDLKGLVLGRPVRLQIPALGDTLDVKVDVISPRIDAESRTCDLLMRFQNPSGRIRPGMFVRASIAGEILTDRLLVPREAILTRDGRPLLFKVASNKAQWVYVELGKSNDRFVEITKILQGGPLEPGTPVVISDHLTLTHDAPVKVKKIVDTEVAWAIDDSES